MFGLKAYFRNKINRINKKEFISLFLLLLFLGYVLWLLFDTHILQKDSLGNLLTGESTYGDLPFHLSNISQMSYGGIFPPENPFFAGLPLVYPYFINVLSAKLVGWGIDLRNSIILPSLFFSLLSIELLYFFFKKITKSHVTSVIAVLLFWFNGGLGFYYFIKDVVLKNSLTEFITTPNKFPDYSHVFSENIHWANFLSRIVVPERSVLLGIPMGILVLYLLFVKKIEKKNAKKELFIAAVLTGLLPLSHTHTFITFALVIPFLAFFEISKEGFKNWLIKWGVFGLIVFFVSLPQILWILGNLEGSGQFIRFHFGWMAEPGIKNFFIFWFKNAGILIPLMILSLFIKRNNPLIKRMTLVGIIIFVIINLFLFQPFDWDNVKFLFWTGIFGALAASTVLVFAWEKWGIAGKMLAIFLFLGMTSSASLSVYREVRLQHQLFSKEEVELADWVRENTPPESIFLTAPIHNSFANNLAGRRVFLGYQGLLWVHGINYSSREADLINIYKGDEDSSTILLLTDIDYVVVGPRELNDVEANLSFFERNYCLVKESKNYNVFQVKDCILKTN